MTCLISFSGFAQSGESDEYWDEIAVGLNFNTVGGLLGGVSIRYSNKINTSNFRNFTIEINEIKHAKENRVAGFTGQSYIFAKKNHLFSIRPQYGREFVLFNKSPKEGVRLSTILAGGPSFGLLKRYYIDYNFADVSQRPDIQTVPYEPTVHEDFGKIYGASSFFNGFDDIRMILGFHAKIAANFEFGKSNYSVSGVEAGFLFEAFAKQPELIEYYHNASIYTSVYLTLYYGIRW